MTLRGLGVRAWRGLLWGAGIAALLLALAVVAFETSTGRSAVLRAALGAVEARTGLVARAEGMDIALLRREVRVRSLTLALPDAPPLLRIAELRLAWGLVPVGRGVVPESVEAEGVRVDMKRGDDGRWNWPLRGRGPAPGGAPILPQRISLRDVSVAVNDASHGLEVLVDGIGLEALGSRLEIAGTLDIKEPLRWRAGKQTGEVAFTPTTFRLGQSLTFEGAGVRSTEASVRLRGTWSDVFGDGHLGLAFDAALDLRSLAARAGARPQVEGSLHLEGRISGALGEPRIDVNWRSDDTRAAGHRLDLAGRVAITAKGVDLGAASVKIAGGSVEGSGRFGFLPAEASRIEARGNGLDLGSLLAPHGERPTLRGRLAGHLRASWPGLEWWKANGQVVAQADENGTEGLPVKGDARLDLRAGKWVLVTQAQTRADARLTGQLEGVLGSRRFGDTSVAGSLELAVDDFGPLVAAFRGSPLAGRGRGHVVVSGTLGAPRAAVDFVGLGLRVGQSPPLDLTAQAAVDRVGLIVERFDLHSGSAHAQATGRLLFADQALDGRYEVDLPDLTALRSVLPAGFFPAGNLHAQGSLGGTLRAPDATLSAQGGAIRMAGQAVEAARFELRLDGPWLHADAVELVQAHGKLSAIGQYDRRGHQFSIGVHGRTFEIAPLPPGLAGPEPLPLGARVDLDFEAGGSLSAPEGQGRVALADGQWQGRSLGPIAADLTLTREGLRAGLTAADLSAKAEVTVGLDPAHAFSASGRLDDADLKAAAQWAGFDASLVSGAVSLGAKASGSLGNLRGATVSLSLEKLAGVLRGRPVHLEREVRLEVAPGRLRVGALDLAVGESRVRLDGALDPGGEGRLEGSVQGRLRDFAEIAGPPLAPDGPASTARVDGGVDVSFVVSGPLAKPQLTGEGGLDEGVFRFAERPFGKTQIPPIEHVKAQGSLRSGTLRLESLEATYAGASLAASGEATGSLLKEWLPAWLLVSNSGPAPKASLRARLEGDAGQILAPFLDDKVRSSGSSAVLTATLDAIALRPQAVSGEIRLVGADLHTSDVALNQEGEAVLQVHEGRVTLEDAKWTGPLTHLNLVARGQIGPEGDLLGGADLEAELTGAADLRLLQAIGRGVESGGTGDFRVKVSGKASDPQTDGEIHLRGGALRHRPTRVALDGLTGTLRWGPAGFEVEKLQGSLNGGPLEVSGALRRRESAAGFEGAVRLQARNAFLEWPPGVRAGLRTNLTLEPQGDGLRLTGSLRVQDGTYRTREYFSLQVLDLVSRFSTGTSKSPIDPLRLDLSLKSSDDVQLDAVDGRLAVGIDLHVGGSVGAPEMGGRLTAGAGGQLFMSGRTYDVESAFLDFTRGAGFEPYLQARATTRVSDYTVVADVAGPATRTQTRFASTPPLGEQDIVALLTSGRTVGAGGTASGADALSMASGGVLGKTGQRLGLDSLKIEGAADPQSLDFDPTAVSSEADPASRLTFSKRLASNLSATFSRSLTKAGSYTWFVAWKPRPSLEVRVVQRDDQTGALEFRHDITIGGDKPAVAPTRRRRRRRTGETVSTVSIIGDPGAARLSDLKLREGQPFDYERWLDDRDRLEDKLAQAGYGEGRVLASRQAPPSEGADATRRMVALVYDVRRGPKTSLTIEGVPSSGDLRTRIELAWRRGDFGATIEQEALALTRAHLFARGYLRAQVTARAMLAPKGDAKTLTVRAEPGTPIRSRRISFEGNTRIESDRLTALVKDAPRAEAAWLVPEHLREAVLALYTAEGLLAANVLTPRLSFVGDLALLTVKIDEGPIIPIHEVSVTGAERLTAEAVLAAAGLRAGQPFKPADVDQAKLRVESAYRRLGYNEATVASHGQIDVARGAMNVAFLVREGAREVLAEIDIQGGPKAQARAKQRLGLAPGAPVVLEEWTEARRRIYETGLFRSVNLEPVAVPPPGDPESDRPVKAVLRVEEWPALRLRYGLQMLTGGSLASEEGRKDLQVGAVAEVSRQTLFGRAASVGLSVQVRQQDQEARAYLSLPRTLGTKLRSSLFLTVIPEHVDDDVLGGSVDIRKIELTWEERIRVTRKVEFAGAYKRQWNRLETETPVPDIGLARLVGTVLFDARNDLIDTSRGAFSSASVEWGGPKVGSDYPLTRTFFQQFVYVPVSRVVLGAAGRAERASGQGSAFLNADRLQAGGANTVRGYSEDALTSRGLVNLLGGSTTLLVLNAELRFPIHGPVRGVLFGDGAISTAKFSEEVSRESIWSTGLGLRYVTPVGILRLDYGIPLDEGWKPERGRVYFSLGQVF